jgi:hypothetical protein
MNDRQIEQLAIMKPAHRAGKDGIHATVGLPAPHQPVDTRVVDFEAAFGIPFDRQHLPLTAHVQHSQDVVEDLVQGQRGRRSSTTPPQMRQDKLLELLQAQFRWNHLPAWVSGHSLRPEIRTLTDLASPIRNPVLARLADEFDGLEKLATSCPCCG